MNRRAPTCAKPEALAAWYEAERAAPAGIHGFCEDCTPEFAARARRAGACNHPEIRFYRSIEDGGVYGGTKPAHRRMLDRDPALSHFILIDEQVFAQPSAMPDRKEAP